MDPFDEVKSDLESSLQSLATLHSSHKRILRTLPPHLQAASEELSWALSELKATLAAVEVEVEELEESVRAIEVGGVSERLGLSKGLVKERRAFVDRVKKEIGVSEGLVCV